MAKERKFKVDDIVYAYDVNRRVYPTDASGRSHGTCYEAGHYVRYLVSGIQGRSYLVTRQSREKGKWLSGTLTLKVSFDIAEVGHSHSMHTKVGRLYSQAERDDRVFRSENAVSLAEHVRMTCSAEQLRKIAEITGFKIFESPSEAVLYGGGEE